MKFALAGPEDAAGTESWLVASPFGAEASVGSAKFQFQQAGANTLVEDFLHPPKDMDPAGVLSIHYDGHVEHVAVSKSVGKTISLPGGKASVEVAEYIPNAQPDANGRFVSRGSQPNNPILELRVHLPGRRSDPGNRLRPFPIVEP